MLTPDEIRFMTLININKPKLVRRYKILVIFLTVASTISCSEKVPDFDHVKIVDNNSGPFPCVNKGYIDAQSALEELEKLEYQFKDDDIPNLREGMKYGAVKLGGDTILETKCYEGQCNIETINNFGISIAPKGKHQFYILLESLKCLN